MSKTDFETAMRRLEEMFPLTVPDPDEFDDRVAAVAELRDPRAIPRVLALADDKSPFDGLMSSMIDSLEVFGADTYVPRFVVAAPELRNRSPRIYRTELKKLIVGESHRRALARSVNQKNARFIISDVEGIQTKSPVIQGAVESFLADVRELGPEDGDE